MTVQARFYVSNIETPAWLQDGGIVHLSAVTRGTENKSWSAATPACDFKMTVSNPAGFKWFQDRLRKDVAVTFEDRPLICSRCSEEISPPTAGTHYPANPAQGLDEDQEMHHTCFQEQVKESEEARRQGASA